MSQRRGKFITNKASSASFVNGKGMQKRVRHQYANIVIHLVYFNCGEIMIKIVLPLAGIILALASSGSHAVDTVMFKGDIVQTCTLSMNTNPLVVEMGKYPTSFFSKKNTQSPKAFFNINISGCLKTKIALKMRGNTVNGFDSILSVSEAKGVGIVVYDVDKSNVYSFTQDPPASSFRETSDSGKLDFKLAAYYYSYEDNVTAGSANASVTVEVIYE